MMIPVWCVATGHYGSGCIWMNDHRTEPMAEQKGVSIIRINFRGWVDSLKAFVRIRIRRLSFIVVLKKKQRHRSNINHD